MKTLGWRNYMMSLILICRYRRECGERAKYRHVVHDREIGIDIEQRLPQARVHLDQNREVIAIVRELVSAEDAVFECRLRGPVDVDKMPGQALDLRRLGRGNQVALGRFELRKQLCEFRGDRTLGVDRVIGTGQLQYDIRAGDTIRLTQFPCDQQEGRDYADDADDLDDFLEVVPLRHP